MRGRWVLTSVAPMLALLFLTLPVWAQAPYYEGKAVTVLIGAKTGSLEIAGQMIAHHLGKYLPGKPAVLVQHMPGAAHAFANAGSANYWPHSAALAWPKATEFFSRHLVG